MPNQAWTNVCYYWIKRKLLYQNVVQSCLEHTVIAEFKTFILLIVKYLKIILNKIKKFFMNSDDDRRIF